MDREKFEQELAQFPLMQYAFIRTDELLFSENVRHICETECPMYGTTWACPPAVGPVAECRERCLAYDEALLITTVAEVTDIEDMPETLATRSAHEEIARDVRDCLKKYVSEVKVLSTEACAICEECAYPAAPCRFPDKMFPCVESYGIVVPDIAEKCGISFLNGGNIVTWFSILLYR
jgi:predicted metal-binding protein